MFFLASLLLAITSLGASPLAVSATPITSPSPGSDVDYGSLHCPEDPWGTLVTPTYGTKGAVFGICTELTIDAPPRAVYDAVLDFQSYRLWNSFIVDVELPPNVSSTPEDVYVGMVMRFTSRGLIGGLNTTSTEVVSLFDDGPGSSYSLAVWHYDDGIGGTGSRAEHPNVFVDLGNGSTRYLSYETYYAGLSTGTIALLKEQLQNAYDVQGRDLKAYVERKQCQG
ncbi:hypothetical protein AAE478_001756 [Parahypoxylon ruwenzoriense]